MFWQNRSHFDPKQSWLPPLPTVLPYKNQSAFFNLRLYIFPITTVCIIGVSVLCGKRSDILLWALRGRNHTPLLVHIAQALAHTLAHILVCELAQKLPTLMLVLSHLGLPEEKERQNSKNKNLQEALLTKHTTASRKHVSTLSAIPDKHKMLTIPKVWQTMTL